MTVPRLETDRLLLREIQPDDVDAIFNCWMRDDRVSRYMLWEASSDIHEAEDFVEFELGNLDNDRWNRWMIVLKSTQELIGTCLLFLNDEEDHWDISYNLGTPFWDKGYMTNDVLSGRIPCTHDLVPAIQTEFRHYYHPAL